jgi:hypothetical protein
LGPATSDPASQDPATTDPAVGSPTLNPARAPEATDRAGSVRADPFQALVRSRNSPDRSLDSPDRSLDSPDRSRNSPDRPDADPDPAVPAREDPMEEVASLDVDPGRHNSLIFFFF